MCHDCPNKGTTPAAESNSTQQQDNHNIISSTTIIPKAAFRFRITSTVYPDTCIKPFGIIFQLAVNLILHRSEAEIDGDAYL
jgi:hypothetical protein